MRHLLLALLLFLPAVAGAAETQEAVRQQVDAYLGSIDTPISAERWKALGPEAVPILVSIAEHPGLPTRRAKALHGLSLLDPAAAAPLAKAFATSASEPLVVRSAAVRVVAQTLPPAEAVAVLKPMLSSANAPLQRRTADALAGVGAPGCRALQVHVAPLAGEARAPFAPALARCTDAAPH
jgi:HEAT repeat protein